MSSFLRKELPLGIATIIIAFLLFDYYFFTQTTRNMANSLSDWAVVVVAEAALVGVINVVMRALRTVQKREPYWYLDIWMVVMMVLVGVTGLIGTYGTSESYQWLLVNLYLAVDATVYSMVAFDIVSAFFRTFRLKSKESAVLLVACVVMIIYNAPVFGGLWPWTSIAGSWGYNVPVLAASRGFQYVTAIGIVGFTIRAMLWKEKPMVGVVD